MKTEPSRHWIKVAGLLLASVAQAHAFWVDPAPRQATALKTGPCGGVARTANFVTYQAGSTVQVTWTETIPHPGWYRIAFSPGTDGDFDSHVLADNIPNADKAQKSNVLDVTLPSTPCDACTLQLIQVMTDSVPSSNYYSCADIRLVAAPVDAGTPPDAGNTPPDAGTPPDDAGLVADSGSEPPSDGGLSTGIEVVRGGCSGKATALSGAMLFAWALSQARRERRET